MKVIAIDPSVNNVGIAYLSFTSYAKFDFETVTIKVKNKAKGKERELTERYYEIGKRTVEEVERLQRKNGKADFVIIERPPYWTRKWITGRNMNLKHSMILFGAFAVIGSHVRRILPVLELQAGIVATKAKAALFLQSINIDIQQMSEHEIDALALAFWAAKNAVQNDEGKWTLIISKRPKRRRRR